MAGGAVKARVLHPSFFTDEKVRQLSPSAKLLLLGLWLRADDYGRAIYLPKLIEGEVFPTEQVDIYALLTEVIQMGLVRPYEVSGQTYYDIPNWERWQKPKYKADSKLPEFPGVVGDTVENDWPEVDPTQIQDDPKSSDGSGLGLLFEKGLEGVSEPEPGGLRAMWQRRREQQRMESNPDPA